MIHLAKVYGICQKHETLDIPAPRGRSGTWREATVTTLHVPTEEPEVQPGSPAPSRAGPVHAPADVADLIRSVNESNEAVEDLCLRARQAADRAGRSDGLAESAAAAATGARVAHRAIQAEDPRRRSPLPRQVAFALITVGLDGLACYFAAQALDASQDATLVWAALFLAVLAGGEFALDFYRDRHQRAWRGLVGLLGAFIVVLGILRFWYLATVGYGGLVPAVAGAGLFTAATAGFVFLGYRALRAAETSRAWRARRWARAAARKAEAARAVADRDAAERDRLLDAYIEQVRRFVLRTCPADQQLAMESAVRDYLLGKVQAAA